MSEHKEHKTPEEPQKEMKDKIGGHDTGIVHQAAQIAGDVAGSVISAMEASYDELQAHYDGLAKRGNISRADAEQLVQYCAEAFQDMPLGSFTQQPSKVNYEPAMEGLLQQLGTMALDAIKAAIRALIDFIKKVWDYILRQVGLREELKNSPQRIEAIQHFEDKVKPMSVLVADTDPRVHQEYKDLEAIVRKYQDGIRQSHADILDGGNYSDLFAQFAILAQHSASKISDRLEIFLDAIEDLRKETNLDQDGIDGYAFLFEKLAVPLEGKEFAAVVRKSKITTLAKTHETTIVGVVGAVSEHYGDVRTCPPIRPIPSLDELSVNIKSQSAFDLDHIEAIFNNSYVKRSIEKCGKLLEKLYDVLEVRSYPPQLQSVITPAFRTLRTETNTLSIIVQRNSQIADDRGFFYVALENYLFQKCKLLKKKAEFADAANHDEIQKEMRDLQNRLRSLR